MENSTIKKIGKLDALFLEVSQRYAYGKLHEVGEVLENGGEMYRVLFKLLAGGNKTWYRRNIRENVNLSRRQQEILTPGNHVIDIVSFDFSMYLKIMGLLNIKSRVIPIMIDIRNCICHYSVPLLRQDMTEEEFINKSYTIQTLLDRSGIERKILDRYWGIINNEW